ncbi:MAG: excinuclease ABC subunit UvrC [Candidatus Omnitrophica bacterium]|nr:excinuclease ABC subunit UvrC [Candidatus Omnitrophota bacterium]
MNSQNLREKIRIIPDSPGVYLFKDKDGRIIYVGKSSKLRSRLNSYFTAPPESRKSSLLDEVADIEVIPVASEGEALVLECSLIKKYQPQYNVDLRDGKTYPWLKITSEDFPSVQVIREQKKPYDEYFGPFTDVKGLKQVLRFIRKYYPVRTCRRKIVEGKTARPCAFYFARRCCGPCAGKIDRHRYEKVVDGIRAFFSGKYKNYTRQLKKQLDEAIKKWDFEEAKLIKERIGLLEKMAERLPWRSEDELLLYRTENVLPSLAEKLGLGKIPSIIEGYDISHLGGNNATGSRVVFKGGIPFRDGYRKFRIKTISKIDDFKMLREVVRRRFTDPKMQEMPDLILVDGGKGQLNEVIAELKELKIKIPVVALAKKEETVFSSLSPKKILLPRDSRELHLLQNIRDEAHRFARGYHLKLRSIKK